jgi:hypothetical protein
VTELLVTEARWLAVRTFVFDDRKLAVIVFDHLANSFLEESPGETTTNGGWSRVRW